MTLTLADATRSSLFWIKYRRLLGAKLLIEHIYPWLLPFGHLGLHSDGNGIEIQLFTYEKMQWNYNLQNVNHSVQALMSSYWVNLILCVTRYATGTFVVLYCVWLSPDVWDIDRATPLTRAPLSASIFLPTDSSLPFLWSLWLYKQGYNCFIQPMSSCIS